MKLTSEDTRSPTESNCCVQRNSLKQKWESDIKVNMLNENDRQDTAAETEEITEDNSVMSAYQDRGGGEITKSKAVMMRRKEITKDSIDSLIMGVNDCRIRENGKSTTVVGKEGGDGELSERLLHLNLETERATSKREGPKEDDERGENSPEVGEQVKYEPQRVRMVALQEPTPNKEITVKKSEALYARSPAGGVAVYPKNNRSSNNNNFFQQGASAADPNSLFWHQQLLQMPDNFPNYDQYQNQAPQQQYVQGMGSVDSNGGTVGQFKRCMDAQELYPEAPKFVRPQQVAPNNLDAPGMPLPSGTGTPLSPTSFKPVSSVCTKQMAGATVFTAEEQPQNPSFCQLPPPVPLQQQQQQQPLQQGWIGNYQQRQEYCYPDNANTKSQLVSDIPDFLDEALNNDDEGRVNSEEIERLLETAIAATQGQNDTALRKDLEPILSMGSASARLPGNILAVMARNQQGGDFLSSSSTPPQTNMMAYNDQQILQQPASLPQTVLRNNYKDGGGSFVTNPVKNNAHRNSQEDMGYATDQSPCHESSQFSPSPSSVMAASPASSGPGASPRDQNFSPPPSNMSVLSQDSGVCSPMSEDGRLNYGQNKSPRSVQRMGPTEGGSFSEMCSPPHPSSGVVIQTAREQQLLQSCDTNEPMGIPPFIVPPVDNPLSPLEMATDENYHHPFVDANLPQLSDALDVANKDVCECITKSSQPPPSRQQQNQQQPTQAPQWQQTVKPDVAAAVPQLPVSVVSSKNNAMPPQLVQTKNALALKKTAAAIPVGCKNVSNNIIINNSSNNNIVTTGGKVIPIAITTTAAAAAVVNSNNNSEAPTVINGLPVPSTIAALSTNAPTALVITTTNGPLLTNEEGKVPIPALPRRGKQQINTAMGQRIPVYVLPQKPRFANIAPKDPTKQTTESSGTSNNVNGNNNNGNNSSNNAYAAKGKPESGCGGQGSPNGNVGGGGNNGGGAQPNNASRANNKLNCARRLVANLERKDLEFHDAEGDTNLHVAVCRTDAYLITALLERLLRAKLTCMINKQNCAGQTPLYLAVSSNDPEKVKVLVEKGADVSLYAEYNGTQEMKAAIHCASSKGHTYLDTLKMLLTATGIQVDQPDSQGHTALHCAILNHGKTQGDNNQQINSIPIIETLLAAGANPNLQVRNGRTALMFALETENLDVFEKLYSSIDPSEREKSMKTPDCKGNSAYKMAERLKLKPSLSPTDQQRLHNCLKRSSYQRNSGSGGSSS